MQHRWYDKNPTLSMAISLLQNASHLHQEMAAQYLFSVMKNQGILDSAALSTQTGRIQFLFPTFRRNRFEIHARHLVEVIKHLSDEHQQDLAVQLINYIYMLDCGMSDFPLPEREEALSIQQHELG
ncbi:hypothetical protein [Vampirovibrio sp.]|uniref:hypothetical protein n=1 Tax=Vampirovibrio sp. TaxID=2717857 RepID=UPI0035941DB1